MSLQRPQNVGKVLAGLRMGPLEMKALSSLGLNLPPISDVPYIAGLQWTDWVEDFQSPTHHHPARIHSNLRENSFFTYFPFFFSFLPQSFSSSCPSISISLPFLTPILRYYSQKINCIYWAYTHGAITAVSMMNIHITPTKVSSSPFVTHPPTLPHGPAVLFSLMISLPFLDFIRMGCYTVYYFWSGFCCSV